MTPSLRWRACCWLLAWLAAAGAARADHDEGERQTDLTAYTLRHGEWRLGLMQLGLGLFDRLQLTTYTLPWIAGAAVRKVVPNAHLKCMFWDRGKLSLGMRAGFYYLNSRKLLEGEQLIRLFATPLNLAASYRFDDRFSLSSELTYVAIRSDGHVTASEMEVAGVAATNNLQLNATFEWRHSRHWATLYTMRWLAYARGVVTRTHAQLDERTSAEVVAQSTADGRRAASGSFTVAWSYASFNVELGAGYGAYFVGGLGLVYGKPVPYPVFDAYFRF